MKIYPEKMPLSTLQFTERFGYRQENALDMLTMGCYNTLWTLHGHLEEEKDPDERDRVVLELVRKWTGIENWPENEKDLEDLRTTWKCQRTSCVFHAQHCRHGGGMAGQLRPE